MELKETLQKQVRLYHIFAQLPPFFPSLAFLFRSSRRLPVRKPEKAMVQIAQNPLKQPIKSALSNRLNYVSMEPQEV